MKPARRQTRPRRTGGEPRAVREPALGREACGLPRSLADNPVAVGDGVFTNIALAGMSAKMIGLHRSQSAPKKW